MQNQSFLPQTINPVLIAATNPALLALPAKSLDGTVGITTANLNATSRPLPPLTLTLRYRLFDFNDMTDELVFPANVVSDKTVTAEAQRATRFDQRRQNVDTEGRWRFGPMAAVGLGGGWEGIHRSSDREVQDSNEAYAKAYAGRHAGGVAARPPDVPALVPSHRGLQHRGPVQPHDRR